MSQSKRATLAVVLALSGCAAQSAEPAGEEVTSGDEAEGADVDAEASCSALADAGPEPSLASIQELGGEFVDLDQGLSDALSGSAVDCTLAAELRERICELAERVCRIAEQNPDSSEAAMRCEDGTQRCTAARALVGERCE